MEDIKLDEPILEDDYPVHADYLYIVDGEIVISNVFGTVLTLKHDTGGNEIRRCDIYGRRKRTDSLALLGK